MEKVLQTNEFDSHTVNAHTGPRCQLLIWGIFFLENCKSKTGVWSEMSCFYLTQHAAPITYVSVNLCNISFL